MSVTDYDGKGALHEGSSSFNDCTVGDQSSNTPIIEVADGGSVKNVIFGKNVGDGIHCLGSCTIDNVWFPYICDDAITIDKDNKATKASTISNSGFKGGRDKIIQHNGGTSTLNITNVIRRQLHQQRDRRLRAGDVLGGQHHGKGAGREQCLQRHVHRDEERDLQLGVGMGQGQLELVQLLCLRGEASALPEVQWFSPAQQLDRGTARPSGGSRHPAP